MPADRSDAACTVAGVRKPSMNETAGSGRRWCRGRYGDLGAVRDLSARYFFEGCIGLEGMHNFGVMARVLHKWGKLLLPLM